MASSALFERNCCSMSEPTLNEAWITSGDKAFHVPILPAKWVKIGLQYAISKYLEAYHSRFVVSLSGKGMEEIIRLIN